MAGVGLQSTLSPVNLHSTMVCDMYTCADDVVCCGLNTLKCILKEGARRSKRRAAHHSRQALTAIERILEWKCFACAISNSSLSRTALLS